MVRTAYACSPPHPLQTRESPPKPLSLPLGRVQAYRGWRDPVSIACKPHIHPFSGIWTSSRIRSGAGRHFDGFQCLRSARRIASLIIVFKNFSRHLNIDWPAINQQDGLLIIAASHVLTRSTDHNPLRSASISLGLLGAPSQLNSTSVSRNALSRFASIFAARFAVTLSTTPLRLECCIDHREQTPDGPLPTINRRLSGAYGFFHDIRVLELS